MNISHLFSGLPVPFSRALLAITLRLNFPSMVASTGNNVQPKSCERCFRPCLAEDCALGGSLSNSSEVVYVTLVGAVRSCILPHGTGSSARHVRAFSMFEKMQKDKKKKKMQNVGLDNIEKDIHLCGSSLKGILDRFPRED